MLVNSHSVDSYSVRQDSPAVIALPAEIDAGNCGQVQEWLTRALGTGAAVLVADLTGTRFCDCAGITALIRSHRRAAAAGARLRVAASPAVRRMLALTGAGRVLDTYPGLAAALADPQAPSEETARHPAGAGGAGVPAGCEGDVTELILADHRRIRRRARALRDYGCPGSGGAGQALAGAWDWLAGLIEAHLSAEEEICWLPVHGPGPAARAQIQETAQAIAGIRAAIAETRLQPAGSTCWWQAASDALRATTGQFGQEEAALARFALRADPALRGQLARQWLAFLAARHHDQDTPETAAQA